LTPSWDDQSKARQLAAYLETVAALCAEYGAAEPVPDSVRQALWRAMGWAENLLSRNHFLEPHAKPLREGVSMTLEGTEPQPLTCGELRWHASALASVLKVIGTDPPTLPARSVQSKRAVTLPIRPTRGRRGGPHPR